MKRFVLLLILIILIPFNVDAQGRHIMTGTIETESGRRTVEIRYYAGSEEWAKDVLKYIREGFPLLEELIGIPCPTTYNILVIETTELDPGVAAINNGPQGLLVPTDTSIGTIIHELCHYWFGWQPLPYWSNWILEGFPEAYTIFVLQKMNHPDAYTDWYTRLEMYEWAKYQIGDKPLDEVGYAPDFEDPRVDLLYSKAMVYCRWLILYFGEEVMHHINEEIIFMNSLKSDDYQNAVEYITGQDLDWLFSGWVYWGEYYYEGRIVSFEWFAGDGDNDGIPTLEEIETGSSPLIKDTDGDGLPDGYELLLKTDIENADTDSDGLKDGEEVPIIVDGINTEWISPLIRNEDSSLYPLHIKAVYYAADNTSVYFMIELYRSDAGHQTGILIDTDDDGRADYVFFLWYDHLSLGIWENDEYRELYDPESLKGTFAVVDQVIEMRIPKRMRYVRLPPHMTVWATQFFIPEGATVDVTDSVSVSLDRNVEGTNPLIFDSSNDLHKDDMPSQENHLSEPEKSENGPTSEDSEGATLLESDNPDMSVNKEADKSTEQNHDLRNSQLEMPNPSPQKVLIAVVLIMIPIVGGLFLIKRSSSTHKHEKLICPRCGYDNEITSKYCDLCGTLLYSEADL